MDSSVMLKVHIIPLPANKLAWHLFHALISSSGCSVLFNLGWEEERGTTENSDAASEKKVAFIDWSVMENSHWCSLSPLEDDI